MRFANYSYMAALGIDAFLTFFVMSDDSISLLGPMYCKEIFVTFDSKGKNENLIAN